MKQSMLLWLGWTCCMALSALSLYECNAPSYAYAPAALLSTIIVVAEVIAQRGVTLGVRRFLRTLARYAASLAVIAVASYTLTWLVARLLKLEFPWHAIMLDIACMVGICAVFIVTGNVVKAIHRQTPNDELAIRCRQDSEQAARLLSIFARHLRARNCDKTENAHLHAFELFKQGIKP